MAKITIDGQDYESDKLSQPLQNQLALLRAADREIQRLNVQLTLAQTARNTVAAAVKTGLEEEGKKAKA